MGENLPLHKGNDFLLRIEQFGEMLEKTILTRPHNIADLSGQHKRADEREQLRERDRMRKAILCTASALASLVAAPALHAQTTNEASGDVQDTATTGESHQDATARSGGIQDIIVTAQRRSENVQNVPIAISAFSSDQLQSRGVSNTLALAEYVPNFVAMNNTGIGSANAYYLRGLGNTESIATFDPPVGTYVDDIYMSRQNANNLSMFDVERVEVLRGPQGTLFGRNTTGGAINVIMRKPSDTFSGYGEIGYGRYNKRVVRGSVDVPLTSTFLTKFSGYWQNDDGYVKNVTTGQRLNDDDGWGVRVGVHGDLNSSATWDGSYAHIVSNGENIVNFKCNPADPSECDGRYATTGMNEKRSATSPYAPLVISGRKAYYPLGNRTNTELITSNVGFDVGPNSRVNFITGFVDVSQQYALDFFDGRGAPTIANPYPPVMGYTRGGFSYLNDARSTQFTQEIKASGHLFGGFVDYVAGVYYINEINKTDYAGILSITQDFPLLLNDDIVRNKTEASAAYAQADFNITDQLKLTGGIRYTDETKTLRVNDNRPQCSIAGGPVPVTCLDNANLIGPSGKAIPTKLNTKMWTPRFAINYKVTPDVLLYASATRGFKSGGWNARATTPSQLLPFGPEKVWSYETGFKSELLDHHVRLNLTAYLMDVTDLQTPSALIAANGSATFLTRNFADLRNKGIEGEFTVIPVNGLNLYANFGYQDAKYRIDRNAPDFDEYGIQSVAAQQAQCLAELAAGNIPGSAGASSCEAGIITADGSIAKPVRTPKWSLALGGSYEAPIGSKGMTLVPSVNASFRSASEVATANDGLFTGAITGTNGTFPANPFQGDFITGSHSKASWLFNASLALNGPDSKWQLSAECQNCFDKSFVQTYLAGYTYYNPPMTWLVKARINF